VARNALDELRPALAEARNALDELRHARDHRRPARWQAPSVHIERRSARGQPRPVRHELLPARSERRSTRRQPRGVRWRGRPIRGRANPTPIELRSVCFEHPARVCNSARRTRLGALRVARMATSVGMVDPHAGSRARPRSIRLWGIESLAADARRLAQLPRIRSRRRAWP
jgi:hypothetical protein